MSTGSPSYTESQRREAADWFVTLREENAPQTESIQAWLRWMDQDEGNRAAFDAVARTWHAVPNTASLTMPSQEELLADDYAGEESVAEWLAKQSTPRPAIGACVPRTFRPQASRRAWFAAVAAVLLVITGVLTMNRYFAQRSPQSDEFTTQTGEQMEITLSDGSHVWLGPKSRLLVAFDKARRGIQLTTGEAFFSVKKDRARPFIVRSSGGDIVAVGTAFNVRAVDEHVTVAVTEGMVAVTPMTQLAVRTPASVRVASGQQLTFTAEQPLKALTIMQSPAPGERARWREGVLVYRDERLREVVSDLVRYSNVQIEIDPAVGELHYSGVIYHDAVDEWITALPESFPVTVVSNGTREIIKAR